MQERFTSILVLFLFLVILVSGCAGPSGQTGIQIDVADIVDVSLDITSDGVVVTSAGLTVPIIKTGLLDVGWRTGVEWAREEAQSTPNNLYVIYEDESGNTRQDVYDIGSPFKVNFRENEWVRTIERLQNGSIIVAVETDNMAPVPIDNPSGGECPGAEPQRVQVGEMVFVCTKSDNLIVRSGPSRSGVELFRISPGTRVQIIDGPTCANSSSWWKVEVQAGIGVRKGSYDAPLYNLSADTVGWVREGSDEMDRYFICKVE